MYELIGTGSDAMQFGTTRMNKCKYIVVFLLIMMVGPSFIIASYFLDKPPDNLVRMDKNNCVVVDRKLVESSNNYKGSAQYASIVEQTQYDFWLQVIESNNQTYADEYLADNFPNGRESGNCYFDTNIDKLQYGYKTPKVSIILNKIGEILSFGDLIFIELLVAWIIYKIWVNCFFPNRSVLFRKITGFILVGIILISNLLIIFLDTSGVEIPDVVPF
jgi:hypothetical protein